MYWSWFDKWKWSVVTIFKWKIPILYIVEWLSHKLKVLLHVDLHVLPEWLSLEQSQGVDCFIMEAGMVIHDVEPQL